MLAAMIERFIKEIGEIPLREPEVAFISKVLETRNLCNSGRRGF